MSEVLLFTELAEDRLDEIARELLKATSAKIFLLSGPMGSGKTTFIKAMCRALGSRDEFSSPTFSIVNEYRYPGGKIFHFDLYRLKNGEELLDIGFEEYLDSGEYCFIEWLTLAADLAEDPHIRIEIETRDDRRYLTAEIIEHN
jgi:tRNA threonylcarbamoyladenosine biosynthesis protein TsaE